MSLMKSCRTLLVLGAALLAAAPIAAAESKPGIAWLDDWGKALAAAKADHRPILLEFYTSWCLYCGKLEKETFADARVVGLAKEFVCVRLDADVAKGVAARYSPEGFPTIIIAAPNGEEIVHISGFRDAATIHAVLRVMTEQGPKISDWIARIDGNPKDLEAREALGRTYLDLGVADKAEEHLQAALKAKPSNEPGKDGESAEARIQFLLGRAYAAGDDYARAIKLFDKLIAANPGSARLPAYWLELAKAYVAEEKADKAKEAVAALESGFPGSPEAEAAKTLLK
jgi:thioredoxin 1